MTGISWAWIAGYFEGEGHIYWQEGVRGTKQGRGARCIIGQKEKSPQDAVYNFLIAHGINPIFYLRDPAKGPYPTALWMIHVQRRADVLKFLSAIAPMLFQKQSKANFVIERLTEMNRERQANLGAAIVLKKSGLSWRDVSRQMGIGRVAINNYARAEGIDLSSHHSAADWISARQDKINRGLCEDCPNARGTDGTARKCRKCADRYNKKYAGRKHTKP